MQVSQIVRTLNRAESGRREQVAFDPTGNHMAVGRVQRNEFRRNRQADVGFFKRARTWISDDSDDKDFVFNSDAKIVVVVATR